MAGTRFPFGVIYFILTLHSVHSTLSGSSEHGNFKMCPHFITIGIRCIHKLHATLHDLMHRCLK